MQITIDHETNYAYDHPVPYAIQSLRLTPLSHDGQVVRTWSVRASGADLQHSLTDGFGNVTHIMVIDRPHEGVSIRVQGRVDTRDTSGMVRGTIEPMRPVFFLRETELTEPDGAIRALARAARGASDNPLDCLHRLMATVRDAIEYKTGETHSATSAVQALAKGVGVCQDHAQVFIAAARCLDIPTRYVSGYLLSMDGREESEASHAWAEAMVPDLGWVGFDVANGVCTCDHYIRVGVGLDYRDAAPVRGVRRGGGAEELSVTVRVSRLGGASQ